jgi:hypothetical protein
MREAGLDVIHFPIVDKWVPSAMEGLVYVIKKIQKMAEF